MCKNQTTVPIVWTARLERCKHRSSHTHTQRNKEHIFRGRNKLLLIFVFSGKPRSRRPRRMCICMRMRCCWETRPFHRKYRPGECDVLFYNNCICTIFKTQTFRIIYVSIPHTHPSWGYGDVNNEPWPDRFDTRFFPPPQSDQDTYGLCMQRISVFVGKIYCILRVVLEVEFILSY